MNAMSALRPFASVTRALPSIQSARYSTLKTHNPLVLYTAKTPNGRKVSVLLEELKAIYGLNYDVHKVNLSENTQKQPWFIKMNPNGRIPVIVDRARDDFTVFETAAILLYLEHHYDTERQFSFDPIKQPNEYSEMLQWMFWAHGGLGPMQGQASHFRNAAPVEVPYAEKRYIGETERLYGVMDIRLAQRDYLAGPGQGTYSIADINAQPWIARHKGAGIETLEKWPHLQRWFERISSRPGVISGHKVPE